MSVHVFPELQDVSYTFNYFNLVHHIDNDT